MDINNTVLLVDNDEVMHYLIQVILDKFKVSGKIKATFNGQEALSYLAENASESNFPKLIITNLMAEGINGKDLIKAIIANKYYNPEKTEIFVLAPELKEEEKQELLALGVDRILPRFQLPEGYGRLRS